MAHGPRRGEVDTATEASPGSRPIDVGPDPARKRPRSDRRAGPPCLGLRPPMSYRLICDRAFVGNRPGHFFRVSGFRPAGRSGRRRGRGSAAAPDFSIDQGGIRGRTAPRGDGGIGADFVGIRSHARPPGRRVPPGGRARCGVASPVKSVPSGGRYRYIWSQSIARTMSRAPGRHGSRGSEGRGMSAPAVDSRRGREALPVTSMPEQTGEDDDHLRLAAAGDGESWQALVGRSREAGGRAARAEAPVPRGDRRHEPARP
jgi:hypothetical protein